MAALPTQQAAQIAQTQVRLQLSTRDEGLRLPSQAGPILVPTGGLHFFHESALGERSDVLSRRYSELDSRNNQVSIALSRCRP
jgi:hypothetical protein